jgi:hypothetical protein
MMPRDLSTIIDAADVSPGLLPRWNDRQIAPKSRDLASIATLDAPGRATSKTGDKSKSP